MGIIRRIGAALPLPGGKSGAYGSEIWEAWSEEDHYSFLRARSSKEGLEGVDYRSRAKVRELLEEGTSILDVGCNTAVEYEGLQKYGPRVKYVGADFTKKAVRIAKRLFPETPFCVSDARALPFADRSFDVVIARHLLEHMPEAASPVREFLRVARRKVIIVFFLELQNLSGRERRDENFEGKQVFDWTYDRSFFYELLRDCPKVVEHRFQGKSEYFPDRHELVLEAFVR